MSLSQGIVLHFRMREWLSGGASPSQGEGRGFESRLALIFTKLPDGLPESFFYYKGKRKNRAIDEGK